MSDVLAKFEELIQEGKTEVSDGVWLLSGEQVSIRIYKERESTIVEFLAPFPYIHITKLGLMRLANMVKPRIQKVIIGPKTIKLEVDGLPDFEIERSQLEKV